MVCRTVTILTENDKLLLQTRGEGFSKFPNYISAFGGKIDSYETPVEAIVRELNEELGVTVPQQSLTFIGAVTEKITEHKELVFEFFWHDKRGEINACYEGQPIYFDNCEHALSSKELMPDVIWLLNTCQTLIYRLLLKN